MKIYFFAKHPEQKSELKTFALLPLRLIFFYMIVFCEALPGQICDKKATIYFETDQFSITASENEKLEKLTTVFAHRTDTFFLEVHAFTDSIASLEYNYKLASNRLKTVIAYLKKNSPCYFETKEIVRGETMPLGSNATDAGRSKNRRVDIFYWRLSNGRITLKGTGGTEIDIQKDYFGPCGICESDPKMTEVFTNEEAAAQGIPLATTSGDSLITGGMMNLEFGACTTKNKNWPCTDVIIRIPAASPDEGMEVWKTDKVSDRSNMKWYLDEKGQLEYDAKNKCYLMKINFCPGDANSGPWFNCDKPKPRRVKDSVALVATPELTRAKQATYGRAMTPGNLVYGGGQLTNSMWGFLYRGKGSVFFADSGIGENKIGYKFSGIIDRYEADCGTERCQKEKQCWCFEIPIDAYTEIIYFQKKKEYRLKVPGKYRKYDLRLFIPAADTLLPLTKVKGSNRKYAFQQPVPDTYIVMYDNKSNINNKRAYNAQIDLSQIRTKHSKRHKYYKAKITRRQLKKAIAADS
jgi:hypothetical protein